MAKRVPARRIKANRHYTYDTAAEKLGRTPQTIRMWGKQGLPVMTDARPHLILGEYIVSFLAQRQAPKRRMPLDRFKCFRCKSHVRPLEGMAFYAVHTATSGRLEALCEQCEAPCVKFVSKRDLPDIAQILEIVRNDAEQD